MSETTEARAQIRIVRTSAQAALRLIANNDGKIETRRIPAGVGPEGYYGPREERFRDPDADEMEAALRAFLDATAKFATGAPRAL